MPGTPGGWRFRDDKRATLGKQWGLLVLRMTNFRVIADPMTGLERAIMIIGGQAELARHLEIHQTTVWEWVHKAARNRKKGEPPPKYVTRIAALTEGAVERSEIRPDLFQPQPR